MKRNTRTCSLFRKYALLLSGFALLGGTAAVISPGAAVLPVKHPAVAAAVSVETERGTDPVILPEGTEITFELYEDVSSADAQEGSVVELSVLKPVVVNGKTVISEGRYGEGKVIKVRRSGVFGTPGKVSVQVVNVETVDRQRIPLDGQEQNRKGRDRQALAWMLSLGLTLGAFLVFALTKNLKLAGFAIFLMLSGVLVRGRDAELPARTKFIGTVQKDITINA